MDGPGVADRSWRETGEWSTETCGECCAEREPVNGTLGVDGLPVGFVNGWEETIDVPPMLAVSCIEDLGGWSPVWERRDGDV